MNLFAKYCLTLGAALLVLLPGRVSARGETVVTDADGHPVVFDAGQQPTALSGPQAQRLLVHSLRALDDSPDVDLRVRFEPNALFFSYGSFRGYVGLYEVIYSHKGPVPVVGYVPGWAAHFQKPAEIDLDDPRSFRVYQYGHLYAAGTAVTQGLFGKPGYTLCWEKLSDAEDFVRSLRILNAHPADLDTSIGLRENSLSSKRD